MGCPVRSLKQLENELTRYNKNWAIILLANANSDSKAIEYIVRNFHIMDVISDDVNFYMPGYCLSWDRSKFIHPDEWMNDELNRAHEDYHIGRHHSNFSTQTRGFRSIAELTQLGDPIFESRRLGPIFFSDADFADFVMEFTKKKKGYFYSGACELILLPIVQREANYFASRVFDLDAIVEYRGGNSIDVFFNQMFKILREGNPIYNGLIHRIFNIRADVIRKSDMLYRNSIYSPDLIDSKNTDTIYNVIADIENCIHWSLREDFFFISYSSRNTMLADYLKLEMQKRGKNVWIAPDGIPQGREYSLVIPTALKLAKTFILLLTPDSAKSHWVKRELDIAISNEPNTKVKVILADGYTIDNIKKDDELNFYLNRVQVRYKYEDIINDTKLFTAFLEE